MITNKCYMDGLTSDMVNNLRHGLLPRREKKTNAGSAKPNAEQTNICVCACRTTKKICNVSIVHPSLRVPPRPLEQIFYTRISPFELTRTLGHVAIYLL